MKKTKSKSKYRKNKLSSLCATTPLKYRREATWLIVKVGGSGGHLRTKIVINLTQDIAQKATNDDIGNKRKWEIKVTAIAKNTQQLQLKGAAYSGYHVVVLCRSFVLWEHVTYIHNEPKGLATSK